ncbi:MAG: glycosyltransferase family 2 protein [Acidobacteriota bacterium]
MGRPLVTIAIPTRNREAHLRETLEDLRGQDYSPIDILISDNASEDGTEALCRGATQADARIRYVRHPANIGLHGNHNFCMDASRGEYLCIVHDHDRRNPAIVREYVSFLETHPTVGVVCSDWDLIDDAGERIGVRDYPVAPVTLGLEYIDQTMRSGRSSIGIPGAMIRRSALGDIRFVTDAPIGFGDFPVWFRLAETADVGHIAKRLWRWRQNVESHSARPIEAIVKDYQQNLERYCDDHLARWPEHAGRVRRWRADIRRYLFWALAYEIGMHFRDEGSRTDTSGRRSLFEIMNYRLTPAQFRSALDQLKAYRSGPVRSMVYGAVRALIATHATQPLAWATRHHSAARTILGMK